MSRLAHRLRDVSVERVDQLADALGGLRIRRVPQRDRRRPADDRNLIPGELVLRQQLADFQFHQVEQLRIVHQVHLVQEHHDPRHVDLAGQQHVLARLRHRAVRRRYHQDRPVHLGGAGDHVLDEVRVPRAVDVGVVPLLRRILHVRHGNREDLVGVAPALLLGGLGHGIVTHRVRQALLRQHGRDRRRQRCLPVVDVADGADVYVRLRTFKYSLSHE